MPKIAIDYSTREVSFYKFICNNSEIKSSYVGHTVDFTKRKYHHKTSCNNENDKNHNCKIYQIMRENGGWNEWKMIEIEKRLVKDTREAERVEQEWIEKLQSNMNSIRAFGIDVDSQKETRNKWKIENKDIIKEQVKKYKLENIDAINKYQQEYYLENREKKAKQAQERYFKNKEKKQQSINEIHQDLEVL